MTHDERVTRLAEQMAKELERSRWERTDGKLGLRTGSVLRPYAAAMVLAEEALIQAEQFLVEYEGIRYVGPQALRFADRAHAALAALRALEAK